MIKVWRKFGLVLIATAAIGACSRMEPVYNVTVDPVPEAAQHKLSTDKVEKIIATTAVEKGWTVAKVKPGLLHCVLRWQAHSASVDIAYSREDYSITLDTSENLKESDGMIHRKYNDRVHQLQAAIDKRLSLVSYE